MTRKKTTTKAPEAYQWSVKPSEETLKVFNRMTNYQLHQRIQAGRRLMKTVTETQALTAEQSAHILQYLKNQIAAMLDIIEKRK